jgi:F-type H+-transporting ATPase subunit gamma
VSDSSAGLRRKIGSAGELRSVVRTMKAVAASSIAQYERSVAALADYLRTIELGLSASFRQDGLTEGAAPAAASPAADASGPARKAAIGAIVFGSDQGLVGQFNDAIAIHAVDTLAAVSGPVQVWAVGERVQARLAASGVAASGVFAVPASVAAITALVAQILVQAEAFAASGRAAELYLFYNRPSMSAIYTPATERLLPLDAAWRRGLLQRHWPTHMRPEVLGTATTTLRALIGEYLFVSLFRACAESLASENASRLAAMQRAEKNIDQLLVDMNASFHRLRQSSIDEELFDVVSGFEAVSR